MRERYLLYLPMPPYKWSQFLPALRARQIRHSLAIVYRLCAYYWGLASPSCCERVLNGIFPHGISHNSRNLKILLQEAQYLGRTVVLPSLTVPPIHNLGRRVVSAIGEYYDLSGSHVRLADGR